MNTRTTHHDRIDAELEALLDSALAPPPAPAGLADRIVAATTPRLHRHASRGVLARIGPALMGVAAAAVFALGAALFVGSLQQTPPPTPGVPVQVATTAQVDPIEAPPGTYLDMQITMFALQVELVDSRDLWSTPRESIEDAALSAELEAYADPVMFF